MLKYGNKFTKIVMLQLRPFFSTNSYNQHKCLKEKYFIILVRVLCFRSAFLNVETNIVCDTMISLYYVPNTRQM